ncbi:MAG: CCA tRNA nucleotidyltransferase [Candidatus Aenigmarchaeota archaeon]|nr:CCA tRNA nucleotidyltransferase [Candidatus Aenigmarchaeota archaeon]
MAFQLPLLKGLITPSAKERKEVEKVTGEIIYAATKICADAKPQVCGSVAKDTWLAGKGEIDIFILFRDSDKNVLETKGLDYGKKIVKSMGGKFRIAYAEHPYVRAVIRGRKVDIVPAFHTHEGELRSNVDRTPHHVRFVLANLGGLNLDVRALKRFCECLGIYGSDLKTEGLSGYLCELLVIRYGGFASLAKASRSWKAGEFIDIKGYHKEKPAKFSEPLVVIDPVDSERNVASVLSETNFFILRKALREFSERPSEKFFRISKHKGKVRKELAARGTYPIAVSFKTPDVRSLNGPVFPWSVGTFSLPKNHLSS